MTTSRTTLPGAPPPSPYESTTSPSICGQCFLQTSVCSSTSKASVVNHGLLPILEIISNKVVRGQLWIISAYMLYILYITTMLERANEIIVFWRGQWKATKRPQMDYQRGWLVFLSFWPAQPLGHCVSRNKPAQLVGKFHSGWRIWRIFVTSGCLGCLFPSTFEHFLNWKTFDASESIIKMQKRERERGKENREICKLIQSAGWTFS